MPRVAQSHRLVYHIWAKLNGRRCMDRNFWVADFNWQDFLLSRSDLVELQREKAEAIREVVDYYENQRAYFSNQ